MEKCIFCQIVAGKSPTYKIYEDDLFMAILDIFPKSRGHILLLTKKHYSRVHDVPEFKEYWATALKIAKTLQKALNPKWTQFFTHGLIPHAHIHVVPRYEPVEEAAVLPTEPLTFSKEEMNEVAETIRKQL